MWRKHRGGMGVALSLTVLGCDGVLYGIPMPYLVAALPDEVAHVSTALLLLLALGRRVSREFLLGYVPASFLIDVDHIPIVIGFQPLIAAAHRPYTHSLLTVAVLLVGGLLVRRRWKLVTVGAACGVAVHLFRDLGTGYVPLLWPIVTQDFSIPYSSLAASVVLAGIWCWLAQLQPLQKLGSGRHPRHNRRLATRCEATVISKAARDDVAANEPLELRGPETTRR